MKEDVLDCYEFLAEGERRPGESRRGIHDSFQANLYSLAVKAKAENEGIDFNHEYIYGIDAFRDSLGRFDPEYNIPNFSQS